MPLEASMGVATSYVNCKQRNLYYLQNKTINCRIAKLLSWNNEQIEYLKRKMEKKYVICTEEGYDYYKKKLNSKDVKCCIPQNYYWLHWLENRNPQSEHLSWILGQIISLFQLKKKYCVV